MSDTTVTPVAPATATATAAPAPIKGPQNPAQGPATGDSTENGDSWHAAVNKINAWFSYFESKLSAPIEHLVTATDADAHSAIKELEDQIAALQNKHDDLVTAHATTAATVAAMPAAPAPEATGIVAKTS